MLMALLGDVMLGRLVNDQLKLVDPAYVWGDTLPILGLADLRFANLECVLADDGKPMPGKVFHFRSDPKNVASLNAAGIGAVSLANNHVLDFGSEALLQMLSVLDRHRILRLGAGEDADDARRAAIKVVDSTAVGFIAFTDNEPDWEASSISAGTYYVPVDMADRRTVDLLHLVEQTKSSVNLLIVSAHWGPNWGSTVPPSHRRLGHALVDAGADVVFGHSAHIFRGIEIYRSRPIIYSAGDFVDDYAIDPEERNDQSFIFIVEVVENAPVALRLRPTIISRMQARLARGGASGIGRRMQRLSDELGTSSTWIESDNMLEIPIA